MPKAVVVAPAWVAVIVDMIDVGFGVVVWAAIVIDEVPVDVLLCDDNVEFKVLVSVKVFAVLATHNCLNFEVGDILVLNIVVAKF